MSKTGTDRPEDRGAARKYAFLLLKFRLRGEEELRQRLLRKKFSRECADETVAWLREKKFIGDAEFARAFMESRLKKPFGMDRISRELRMKGVSAKVIAQARQELSQEYDEPASVREAARSRMRSYRDIDPQKAKRRLFAFLLRRGFPPETIMEEIENL